MAGLHLLFLTKLAVSHCHAARSLLDTRNRASQMHTLPQPRSECIGHALVAALNAKQFLTNQIRSAQFLDSRAPHCLKRRTGTTKEAQRSWRSSVFFEQVAYGHL